MTATREDVVRIALDLDGLTADPADEAPRAAYLDLIAPVEGAALAAQMAKMSGCGLVVRGIWRRAGIVHPRLTRPYVVGRAIADLVEIAREAGAAHPGWKEPAPDIGDAIIVGPDNGAPEHVYTVLEVTEAGAGFLIEGLDGGQRARGHQAVRIREHVLVGDDPVVDVAHDTNEPGAGASRRVRWVLDVGAILKRFG